MLWYKAWLECRFRLIVSGGMLLWFAFSGAMMNLVPRLGSRRVIAGITATSAPAEAFLLFMVLVVGLPMSALILAGSGINAQTSWGMTHGLHPSTQFTLTLPVSRARLLWTRAGLGWVLVLGLGVGALLLVNAIVKTSLSIDAFFSIALASTAFYAIAVWLSTFLDEVWTGVISLTVVGMLTGNGLAGGPGWLNTFGFLQGKELAWQAVVFYAAVSAFMVWAAWLNIRRKEY